MKRKSQHPENPAYLHDHYQDDTPVQDSVNAITGTMAQPPGMEHEVEQIIAERAEVLTAIRRLENLLTSTGKSAIRVTEAGGECIIRTVAIPPSTTQPGAQKIVSYNYNRSRLQLFPFNAAVVGIGNDPNISIGTGTTPSPNCIILPTFMPLVIATVRDIWAIVGSGNAATTYLGVIEEFIAPQDR